MKPIYVSLIAMAVVINAILFIPVTAYALLVIRGPYLQMGTPNSITVRWRTDLATDSRVSYGAIIGNLTFAVDNPTVTTEHQVTLSGLTANTRYYYAVGSSSGMLAGNDAGSFFVTSPTVGVPKPTRIWVLGDSGTASSNARAVRDAYYNFTGSLHTDLWLMLGDNAYGSGSDIEHQRAVFDMYPTMLKKSVLWPTLGNHDGKSASSLTQSGPYYDIFSLPKNAEAGGIASGTEAYYAFDYANIHFIVLDSHDSSRAPGGAMMTWLTNDLQNSNQDWIIAYWHHPPYSKGSHNSDNNGNLTDMRQYALPILENYGVDLVLAGHSHSYERSFLIDGHYGKSPTLVPSMILNGGDGRQGGNGAYEKPTAGLAPHEGAVYTVAGSSGHIGSGSLNHPVMFFSIAALGSLILNVDNNRLNATFLDSTGIVRDTFTIMKAIAVNMPPTAVQDSAMTNEDTPIMISVLTNDTDPENDPLTVFSIAQPNNGSTTLLNNTVIYTPDIDFNGLSSFLYTISDGQGGTSTATVTVTVNPINDPPIANNQSVTTLRNTAMPILLAGIDPDGDPLTYFVVSSPTNGSLNGTAPNLTYTPGSSGFDSFTFQVNDGTTDSNVATVSITVILLPVTTGFRGPTTHAPIIISAGDNNGFQTDPFNAQADDGLFAMDTNSGTDPSRSCSAPTKDKHLFYDYNFSIPPGATINGIEVRLNALVDSIIGTPKLCVDLSSDGGLTWTSVKLTKRLSTRETTQILGNASDLWLWGWTSDSFSNAGFRVRVTSVARSTRRDFSLDWVGVRVTYIP